MIEYANSVLRNEQLRKTRENATACGRFTAEQVRALSRENATLRMGPLADLRQLGCPEELYETILEARDRKRGTVIGLPHAPRVRETAVVPQTGAIDLNVADLI